MAQLKLGTTVPGRKGERGGEAEKEVAELKSFGTV